jgi:adenylate cyclase
MPKEIERKFLIDEKKVPDLSKYNYLDITQGYINLEACLKHKTIKTIRLRQVLHMSFDNNMIGEEFYLNIKSREFKVRDELEISLLKEQFTPLWKECERYYIYKHRYEFPSADSAHLIQLDYYRNDLSDYKTAEVEFKSVEESENYNPESWFLKEVTYNEKFTSLNLLKSIIKS